MSRAHQVLQTRLGRQGSQNMELPCFALTTGLVYCLLHHEARLLRFTDMNRGQVEYRFRPKS